MSANDFAHLIWLDRGWWLQPNGTRRLLSWNAGTKELRLYSIDPRPRDDDKGDLILAVIDSEEEVNERLQGWEQHNDNPDGMAWLAEQLKGCQ